jgi:hypothetical protein
MHRRSSLASRVGGWLVGLSLLALAACGSVGPVPDNGDDDGGGVTRGPVVVTVLDPAGGGGPAIGATVVFIDPDGTLVKRATTDTVGKTTADVLPGASVTAIALLNARYEIETVTAVKPGDDLVIGVKKPDTTLAGMFTFSYPAFTGAATYTVAYPCGTSPTDGPATSVTVPVRNDCRVEPMDIVVMPQDSNEQPLAASFKGEIPFVAGGTSTVTQAYRNYVSFTASYTNIPASLSRVVITRWAPDDYGFFSGVSRDNPPPTTVLTFMTPVSTGAVPITQFLRTPALQTLRQKILGSVQSYSIDVAATLLPWLGEPSYDAAARRLTIPVDAVGTSMARPDAFHVIASYRRNVAGTLTQYNWKLYAPEPGDLTLPQLPQELADIAPRAGEQVVVGATMLEVDTVTGYDAIRNNLGTVFHSIQPGQRRPAGNTVRISAYPQPRLP